MGETWTKERLKKHLCILWSYAVSSWLLTQKTTGLVKSVEFLQAQFICRETAARGKPSQLRCFLRNICHKILTKPVGPFWDHTYLTRSCHGKEAQLALYRVNSWLPGRGGLHFQGTKQGCWCDLQLPAVPSTEKFACTGIVHCAQFAPCSPHPSLQPRDNHFSAAWTLWSLLALPHNEVSSLTDVLGSPCKRKEMSL